MRGWVVLAILAVIGTAALGYLPPDDELPPAYPERAPSECAATCSNLEQGEAADDAGTEVGCGLRCRVDHCSDGCTIWEQALNSSCQEVCNGTKRQLSVKELYCTIGCQYALNQYFQKLKADIGLPPTPSLVEDSLGATSLYLKWESLKQFDNKLLYFVQCKFEDVEETWQYCESQNWNGNNQIFVYNLQPYTRYRFRLAILLVSAIENDRPLFSQPSSIITTFSRGPPTSAPVILKALAIDHSRIYVNWKPGLFTNGPLFSYVLRLQQDGHEAFQAQIKDIPISQDTFMFQSLDANTNYSVTLTMRNGDGEGPTASTFVKTLFEPDGNSSETPILIIASEFSIMKETNVGTPKNLIKLYSSIAEIRDTAIVAPVSQLFLCDASDRLYRVSLNAPNMSSLIIEPKNTTLRPWALSADWLHGWLYVAGANDATGFWEISRCDFDGKNLTGLLPGLEHQPIKLEVDPVNGYLFWMTREGIYRVDLGDFENRTLKVEPEHILKRNNLGAFVVDYENTRLLVSFQSENTIKSVSLDGKVIIDVRVYTKQPRFKNVSSLSLTNGLFFWTDGEEILAENYESDDKFMNEFRYFYSILYNKIDNYFLNVHLLAPEIQPTPFPTMPPTNVQALVLSDRVKISWRVPTSKNLQGRGAWRNWSYALLIEDDINGELIQEREIRETTHFVDDLRDHSFYSIKIAAYSSAGDGPWSKEFKVQTLKKDLKASVLWSSNEGLLQSDLIGGNTEILLKKSDLEEEKSVVVLDVDSYEDSLFIVGNNFKLYQYNTTSLKKNLIKHTGAVSSVAVEWLTNKIYWADPKRQIILRSNIDGTHQEPIIFSKIVKNLLLDTREAYLYWMTSRTVEVVRLNGEGRRRYRSEEDFNGEHVAGLTLDHDNRFVYWVIGDYVGDFKLYRSLTAEMLQMGADFIPELISTMHSITGNSLSYISNRFLFLSSPQEAMASDAYGVYVSSLTNSKSNTNLLRIFLKTPNPPLDPKLRQLIVRPEPVDPNSIIIEGTWRDFNVTWKPCNSTNYGRIFYEVIFADYINVDADSISTSRTSISYANADRLLPYTLISVSVRAYSYWDMAPSVNKVLRSPQSVPSQPMKPRIFIESYKDAMAENIDYFATFRWNMPEFENGPILGFKIECWLTVDKIEVPLCESIDLPVTEMEYKIHSLQANRSYSFKVCAKTEVGFGPYTDPVSATIENENPVPQLLVATIEDVKKVDLDQRMNVTITPHIAVEVAHIAAESKIYWINEMQELVTADVEGKSITKILTLNNTALSLSADWISRNLFWTESSYEEYGISHIMKLDLTVWEAGLLKFSRILSRNRRIVNLDVAPLTGTLFWIELSDSDLGYVIQSDLSGENIQPFFNYTEDCSCPFRPQIQPVFTVDNTEPQSPVIYWISDEGHLNIADIEGCICSQVLEAGSDRGLPPTSLTTDKSYIYWSDMNTHKIHYTDKSLTSEIIKEYPINNVRNIRAIGKSIQPYPDSDCLMPQRAVYNVQKIAVTPTSIIVRLPEPDAYFGCNKYNLPATLYTIDVTECKKNSNNRHYEIDDDACENYEERIRYQTYWKDFEAKDLKPFTKYRFHLTLTNYYSDQESINIEQIGPGLVLRTGAGIPSKPEDVRARPLTPTLAMIDWLPPIFWNAEYVRYKIFWRSAVPREDAVTDGEKMVRDGDVYTHLASLVPGQEYFVSIRVYPENFTDIYNQSEETLLKMYSEPNNLTLIGVASDAMNISWIPMKDLIVNHTLEFTRSNFDRWQLASEYTIKKNRLIYQIKDLNSKEYYKFRLVLKYRNYTENFIWPIDDRFTFKTLEDIPTAPGTPELLNLQNSNYQLRWEPARSHSFQIITYYLEGTTIDSSISTRNYFNTTYEWIALYNGTQNVWDIQPNMHEKYLFRVRARNNYGYGNWSEISSIVDLTEMTRAMVIAQEHLGLILGLFIPILVILLLCVCYFMCPFNKKPKEDQKKIPMKIKPKVELATLREIPRGNFVEANALYVAAVETDSDDSLLPKIQRDQISLAKFLGSGAFGEVFQGVVRDLDGPGLKTPIAVKTLRKGASPQEKNEFIQEAKLMSHFQHKHVLRLLGVCLDTDPPLLLLELMAGGDLLSYLRTSRSLKPTDPSALRLQDLLSMCEDVARGCQYLEELHFVHRDLACRNCLVSAREREQRVVKIGDFGLARDIYKNDYYRKEGEGLLPVRWMAPESLVDGVFTSQSDVWAFGVLMWEITSLGQQPYQARTNLEVLHHVRAGGRLPKPLNCPLRLHQLMLRCWSNVDARPSFKVCLEHIVALRNITEDATLSPVNPGQFLAQGNVYKSSHFRDNLSIQSLLQDSDGSKPDVSPKYSWHLDDVLGLNESKDPRAAYEIPKSIPVVLENSDSKENRYIEICSSEQTSKQNIEETNESYENVTPQEGNQGENEDCSRVSVTSLNSLEKKLDKTPPLDKRSSTSSLGDKLKTIDGLKQSGSYARLVGNGESVNSLSDWRRVKRIASDERERLSTSEDLKSNGSNLISYSMVSFPQTSQRSDNELTKSTLPKLQRTKSNLQTSKANIPLVINSGLLNMLRQAPEDEVEVDDVNYANIDPENVTVTDL